MARTPQTNIRLKQNEREALDQIAKNNGMSRAEQVRVWIRDAQDKQK